MNRWLCHCLRAVAIVCALLALPSGAQQEKSKPNPLAPKPGAPESTAVPTSPAQPAAEMTPADLAAFFDGALPILLQRDDIAGAVVCVVRDGKILFAKGYGYQDVDKKIPITTDTMFRPGSISKLFTWTAVMQLVEQGKLSLDADVNQYLDFRIAGQPVTLRNIMTHTPGFEEEVKDLIQPDAARLLPLADYMRTHQPRQIFAPGTIPAYSNYGAGLAGYIVQRVSGEKFEDYIRAHIFDPLGMQHSSFAQPLPENLKPYMSAGYKRASDPAKWFEMVEPAPAGALAASAGDLARFMIAHLNDGAFPGMPGSVAGNPQRTRSSGTAAAPGSRATQILKPATAQLMHARAFGLVPSMNGMALGFYEESLNQHRIIGHGGDTIYFHSDMHLMADAHLGFFVSFNSAGRSGPPRRILWQRFLDRYFPYTPPAIADAPRAAQDAKAFSGSYISSRRMQTTVLRMISLLDVTKVHPGEKNMLVADDFNGFNGRPKKWKEVGKYYEFRTADGFTQDRLAFTSGPSGELLMVLDFPAVVYQRVPWYYAASLTHGLMISMGVVFVLALLWWIILGPLVRRHYERPLALTGNIRRSRRWLRWAVVIQTAAFAGWLLIFHAMEVADETPTARLDAWFHVVTLIAWLAALGAVAALLHLFHSWTTPQYRWWNRLGETAIVGACFAYLWLSCIFNMYGWNVNF